MILKTNERMKAAEVAQQKIVFLNNKIITWRTKPSMARESKGYDDNDDEHHNDKQNISIKIQMGLIRYLMLSLLPGVNLIPSMPCNAITASIFTTTSTMMNDNETRLISSSYSPQKEEGKRTTNDAARLLLDDVGNVKPYSKSLKKQIALEDRRLVQCEESSSGNNNIYWEQCFFYGTGGTSINNDVLKVDEEEYRNDDEKLSLPSSSPFGNNPVEVGAGKSKIPTW